MKHTKIFYFLVHTEDATDVGPRTRLSILKLKTKDFIYKLYRQNKLTKEQYLKQLDILSSTIEEVRSAQRWIDAQNKFETEVDEPL